MSLLRRFEWWVRDLRWAANMMRARRMRRDMGFSARQCFDDALRPRLTGGFIAYPDAGYHITTDDLIRAMDAAHPCEL